MSNFLYRILPNSVWVLCAVSGGNKEFRTFRPGEREQALEWIAARPFKEIKVLTANPTRIIFGNPTISDLKDALAIGIRASMGKAKALKALQPSEAYPYDGKYVAIWRLRRDNGKPISPAEANAAEQALADRFQAQRLNFFAPIPADNRIEVFAPRFFDLKDVAAMAPEEEDEELSAEISPKQRTFAVEPMVQTKKITLISGDAGMGKSQIALDLAMRKTRGIGLPGQPAPTIGGVMVCEMEDDFLEDVVPRLIANGANRKLIKGISASDLHTDRGVARLEAARQRFSAETGLPVDMLILSPYMACFGGGSNQEVHMREKLKHIERWVKQANIAVLGVAHLDESGGVAGPKTHRRLARGSWKVIVNEDDPEPNEKRKQRLLVADKTNNTPDDFSLAYHIKGVTIQGGIKTSKIVWEDPNFKPQEAPQEDAIKTATQTLAEHFKARLQNGPIDGQILVQEALAMGYSKGTAHNAKILAGIPNTGRGKKSAWAIS